MSYWDWNTAIAQFFFNDSRSGKKIVFYLDHDLLDHIGEENELGTHRDYLQAVFKGPLQKRFPSYYQDLIKSWRRKQELGKSPPFFMAVLGILVLAWTEKEGHQYSYYGALSAYLKREMGIEENAPYLLRLMLPGFEKISQWGYQLQGKIGVLRIGQLHAYKYVGQIKFHALVKPEERHHLHHIWADAGIKPATSPTLQILVQSLLHHHRSQKLIPGFKHLLQHPTPKIRKAIHELIELDFQEWDGATQGVGLLESSQHSEPVSVKICHHRSGTWGLRLYHPTRRGKHIIPLKNGYLQGTIGSNGWSDWLAPIRKEDDSPTSLKDLIPSHPKLIHDGIEYAFKDHSVKVMVPASLLGLVGAEMVEQDKMISDQPCEILFSIDQQRLIKRWIKNGGGEKVHPARTVEEGWMLAKAPKVKLDLDLSPLKRERKSTVRSPLRKGKELYPGCYSLQSLPAVNTGSGETELLPEQPALRGKLRLVLAEDESKYILVPESDYIPGKNGDQWSIQQSERKWGFRISSQIPLPPLQKGKAWTIGKKGNLITEGQSTQHQFEVDDHEVETNFRFHKVAFTGGAKMIPPEAEFPAKLALWARKNHYLGFTTFYKLLEKHALDTTGQPLDRIIAKAARKKMQALGFFLEQPEKSLLQLSPATFLLKPWNRFEHQVLMVGIWTPAMLRLVHDWCRDSKHGLKLTWITQPEPYFPPLGQLSFQSPERWDDLYQKLSETFAGRIRKVAYPYYAHRLLNWVSPVPEGNRPPKISTNNLTVYPKGDQVLESGAYQFLNLARIPRFPAITRNWDPYTGQTRYTWWEKIDHGYHCRGTEAVWKLLICKGKRPFFQSTSLNQIYFPVLPMPAAFERGMVLNTGRLPEIVRANINGIEVPFHQYNHVSYQLRKDLPRLILGADPATDHKTFFQPIPKSDFITE